MAAVETYIVLSRDEINAHLPYALICMTREGKDWETGKRKRRWNSEFTESERERCKNIFKLAHQWTLVKGVPDEVKMKHETLSLWWKLGNFCASL